MLNLNFYKDLFFGKKLPARVWESLDDLFDASLTLGNLIIGRPGTGKTSLLARILEEFFQRHPEQAIFILDASGSITDAIITMTLQLDQEVREKAVKRLRYVELGNKEWVVPLPEFSPKY